MHIILLILPEFFCQILATVTVLVATTIPLSVSPAVVPGTIKLDRILYQSTPGINPPQ